MTRVAIDPLTGDIEVGCRHPACDLHWVRPGKTQCSNHCETLRGDLTPPKDENDLGHQGHPPKPGESLPGPLAAKPRGPQLTPRQTEVWRLHQAGLSQRAIAHALNLSRSTIRSTLDDAARNLNRGKEAT